MTAKKDPIHIKKSHAGKFTAAAKKSGMTVQQKANAVLANPKSSPALRKQAVFAKNAAKWKK